MRKLAVRGSGTRNGRGYEAKLEVRDSGQRVIEKLGVNSGVCNTRNIIHSIYVHKYKHDERRYEICMRYFKNALTILSNFSESCGEN